MTSPGSPKTDMIARLPRLRNGSADRGAVATLTLGVLTGLLAGCAAQAPRPDPPPHRASPPPVILSPDRPGAGRLSPELDGLLAAAPAGGFVEVLADLLEQADLTGLWLQWKQQPIGKDARRAGTIAALEGVASRRKALESWLDEGTASGEVDVWRGFAIVNRVYVSAKPSFIRALAKRPEIHSVVSVRNDRLVEAADAPQRAAGPTHGHDRPVREVPSTSWALDAIGARKAWSLGWNGRGVVVGSLDTGVAGQHTALRPGYRLLHGWFDPQHGRLEPYDDHGHGTEILGCAVGAGTSPGEIGVAPGATWIAARANPLNFYNSYTMTASADWMLRTGRADIIVCAWGHGPGICDETDVPLLRALRLAETVVALPAGNSGPAAGTGETPASLPPLFPGDLPPLSVAAVPGRNRVLGASGRGPSPCAPGIQFPWVAAPGAALRVASARSADGYEVSGGTSHAAGYVAGAAAVLLQSCPSLSVETLQRVLAETAVDIDPPGADPSSGHGLIDLPAALERVRSICPGA